MPDCQRCGKETNITMMSMLNTQTCCMDCIDAEKKHPKYEQAREEESWHVKVGDYNYKGLLNRKGE